MRFSILGLGGEERYAWFRSGLLKVLEGNGHLFLPDADRASVVINFVDPERPAPFRRQAREIFVVTVAEFTPPFGEPEDKGYPLLVSSLGNLLIGLVDDGHTLPSSHFLTPEQGHYVVDGSQGSVPYFERVYERIHPLATSRRVMNNIFDPDLEQELWNGDDLTASISWAGRRLAELNLLPKPFPLEKYLNEVDRAHFKDLFGVGGLSYGNLSARLDADRFWMSASGVDKSDLREVGRDLLLVKGYDGKRNAMVLSVPPHVDPRRVSVDAIEHWMVYRGDPGVGAILHVHAWMEGIPSTEFNYPCGTLELAGAVADIIRGSPIPKEAVVGLKNHGITIAGESMEEIFRRVGKKLYQPVPMS